MKFIMGDILGFGMVGFMYYDTTGYLLARIIVFGLIALAIIGLISILRFIFGGGIKFTLRRGKSQADKERDWLKTGKF